ncbi:MAG: hypothetical protein NTV88_01545 [Candidatus Micrarchaeota archaeon]|nr:hypothetical protein [Candidatus Micrarchaeota archaeon]
MLSLLGKKAQISVEALLVFLVFLILLGIAYKATTTLGAASQNSINTALSHESFNELASKIDQVCILGEGNVRVVTIKGGAATLSTPTAEKRTLHFETPGYTGDYNSSCAIDISQISASRVFTLENIGGATPVRIS